jgi:hypothetical protein
VVRKRGRKGLEVLLRFEGREIKKAVFEWSVDVRGGIIIFEKSCSCFWFLPVWSRGRYSSSWR